MKTVLALGISALAAFALDTQSKGPEVLAEQEPNEGLDDEDEDDEGDEDDTESGDDGENDDDEGARK